MIFALFVGRTESTACAVKNAPRWLCLQWKKNMDLSFLRRLIEKKPGFYESVLQKLDEERKESQ